MASAGTLSPPPQCDRWAQLSVHSVNALTRRLLSVFFKKNHWTLHRGSLVARVVYTVWARCVCCGAVRCVVVCCVEAQDEPFSGKVLSSVVLSTELPLPCPPPFAYTRVLLFRDLPPHSWPKAVRAWHPLRENVFMANPTLSGRCGTGRGGDRGVHATGHASGAAGQQGDDGPHDAHDPGRLRGQRSRFPLSPSPHPSSCQFDNFPCVKLGLAVEINKIDPRCICTYMQ